MRISKSIKKVQSFVKAIDWEVIEDHAVLGYIKIKRQVKKLLKKVIK